MLMFESIKIAGFCVTHSDFDYLRRVAYRYRVHTDMSFPVTLLMRDRYGGWKARR